MAYNDSTQKYLRENLVVGDEGIDIPAGELHTGSPGVGKEVCFGEGDSYIEGMKVFTSPDGSTFTDVTTDAGSGSGSTYNSWSGGTTAGAIDYIGSDLQFCGIKLITDTPAVPGAGSVAREYWNGSAWVAFTALATDSKTLESRADNIGSVAGSEQIRFGDCDDQALTTVNGEEKYWIRFRITANITSVSVIEQIKLHSSRFEVNPSGRTENFGDAIYERDLVMHWHLTEELLGFSPANENISFANGLVLVYNDNQFNSTAADGRGGYLIIPSGLDTSRDVTFEVLWTPLSNDSGNILFKVDTYQTRVGDTLTTANTVETFTDTVAVTANNDNVLMKTDISLNVQNLTPGEMLAFGFKRLGNDSGDTFGGNVALVNIRCIGYFYKP